MERSELLAEVATMLITGRWEGSDTEIAGDQVLTCSKCGQGGKLSGREKVMGKR
jgi:hypothetical protein